MRKILFFALFVLIFMLGLLVLVKPVIKEAARFGKVSRIMLLKPKTGIPFSRIGETITYDIRFGKLHMGRAVFRNVGRSEVSGKVADLITFETKVSGFNDLETIYSDPVNFLPLKIERRINKFSVKERITEDYDQRNFTLTISKTKGKNKEQFRIKRNSAIHNAILLPFYVRRIPKLDTGWTMTAQLPTQQFLIKLVSIEKLRLPSGEFNCYHFESFPKKFEIWVTVDNLRIPVKIKGLGVFGYTMVMRDYNF